MRKVAGEGFSGTDRDEAQQASSGASPGAIILYTIAFVLCVAISIAPLNRLAGADYFRGVSISGLITAPGAWLPSDLHLTGNAHASSMSTNAIIFMLIIALTFLCYGLCGWYVYHRTSRSNLPIVMRLIWIGASIAGLLFAFCPAMLSHDAFVYAGYGRLLAVHYVNPYFTILSVYPHDPLTPLDDWRNAPAAYGPLWILLCTLVALPAGESPLAYILLYRFLGLGAHLLNIFLVTAILRSQKCSPQTIAAGTLMYAWNPLALEESAMGGHNDTLLVTFMLLGILFWVRLKEGDIPNAQRLRDYLPALLMFTLALLVKFTAAPLLALFLVLLARQSLYAAQADTIAREKPVIFRWQTALMTFISGGVVSLLIILLFYLPFWLGHGINAIIYSFTSPPSANSAYGSILSATQFWIRSNGLPAQSWARTALTLLSQQRTWSLINLIVVLLVMGGGIAAIWRSPGTRTLVLASLATLGALLIVTPWFFPWYVVWLVGLAAICLPFARSRLGRSLVAASIAFSASAFFIYFFFHDLPPIGGWTGLTFLTTIGPPLLALLMGLLLLKRAR
jgi:heme/copper-type cytochrome/quinol oxidase subunit 4